MDHGGSACFEVDFSFLLAKHHRSKKTRLLRRCNAWNVKTKWAVDLCPAITVPRTNFGPAKWSHKNKKKVTEISTIYHFFSSHGIHVSLRSLKHPFNGRVWTCIAGVFWGPESTHFWDPMILKVWYIYLRSADLYGKFMVTISIYTIYWSYASFFH